MAQTPEQSVSRPTTIGPYSIAGELGRGGMGVVYLGRDPRLEREVAIKTLPDALATDPEWLARFMREAKVLASLHHPHIASLFGLEVAEDGSRSLVMERVKGETLAERLCRGRLPVHEALELCGQIAQALEAAHEQGVVHRDLKPGNVMVTERGQCKVLDFGLARRSEIPGDGGAAKPKDPTLTETGAVMGTPGYMSPEQATGSPQDKRTDIFSFGCVLYECLSGRRAFSGKSPLESVAALLHGDPDWSALPSETPSRIRDLLSRCLEKSSQRRLRDLGDARIEIEEALGLRRSAGADAAAAEPGAPNNLPPQLTSFVGRERELAECSRLVGQTRLLTLTGVGGAGKSRLMLQVASRMLAEYPDGVWFVDLAPFSDPLRVPEALVTVLGLQEESGRTLMHTLAQHLRAKRALIVLDNCEQMLSAAGELASGLLQGCPQVKILTTSREALAIPGELTYQVPSLSLPPPGQSDLQTVGQSESVRLFVERAAVVRPGFQLDERNAPVVAEICRRLDGIPLAIELAAARAKVLAVEEIRARLDDRFRLLTGGSKAALPRHQTLRATIQWSYDLLQPEEQDLLRSLSVFAGGWTLDAATSVCGSGRDEFEILDLLQHLVDKSLVVVERAAGATRYRFLETVRQYVLDKLNESGLGGAVRDRHLDYFHDLTMKSLPSLTGPGMTEALRRLEAEHENLLAALAWCEDADDGIQKGLGMAGALWRFWNLRGHLALGRELTEKALARDREGRSTPARFLALEGARSLATNLGDNDAALRYGESCLAAAREIGEVSGIARALNGLGMIASNVQDHASATRRYEECLQLVEGKGFDRITGIALNNLGDVFLIQGNYEEARLKFELALAYVRKADDKSGQRVALMNLSMVCLRTGDPEGARRHLIEGLRLVQELGSRSFGAQFFDSIGVLAIQLREHERAARYCGAGDAVRQATGAGMSVEEQDLHDQNVAQLRLALGDERFTALVAEGRAMSFEAAVEYGLRWLEGGSAPSKSA